MRYYILALILLLSTSAHAGEWRRLKSRTASERPATGDQRAFYRSAAALALAKKWPGDYAYGDPPEGANDMAFETVDVVVSSLYAKERQKDQQQ